MKTSNIIISVLVATALLAMFYISFLQRSAIDGLQQKIATVQSDNEQSLSNMESTIRKSNQQGSAVDVSPAGVDENFNKDILNHLQDIKKSMASFEKRISRLEGQQNLASLAEITEDEAEETTSENNDESMSDKAAALQAARAEHYDSLEQSIFSDIDEVFTQEVTTSFEQMVASREVWAKEAALKSAECSETRCKVVLSYNPKMDSVAMTDFDGMVFLWNKELPRATARFESNPDGRTDMIIYFARKGTRLPRMP